MPSRVGVVALVLVGSIVLSSPAAGAGDDRCAGFGTPAVAGAVANPALVEISGLAGSRVHPGVLWTHNDSGGAPEVFAMGEDGADLGAHAVDGAGATDWEDIAVGPGPDPDRSYLYVADIGDNAAGRDSVTVYRVPEPIDAPTSAGSTLTGTEAIELRYPDGARDAEALLVDPSTGDLVVVTKSYLGSSHVLVAPAASLVDGATVTMSDQATISIAAPPGGQGLPGTAVTGGDMAPDGSIVLLRTYQSVLAYPRVEGQPVAEALQATPCDAPQVDEPQGEAVAFIGSGAAYVTASEGANPPIHRVELRVPAAATTVPPTTTTSVGDEPDDSSSETTVRIVLGAALVLGCAVVLVLLVRRRRT
jgi:hypothetical protein